MFLLSRRALTWMVGWGSLVVAPLALTHFEPQISLKGVVRARLGETRVPTVGEGLPSKPNPYLRCLDLYM